MEIPFGFVCPGCGLTSEQLREEERRQAHIGALLAEKATHPASADEIDAELTRLGYVEAKAS